MKPILLAAGAAAIALLSPATADAKPGGGKGHTAVTANGHANAKAGGAARAETRARTDARAALRGRTRTGAAIDRSLDTNRNGIPDYRERALADLDGNGIADHRERRLVDLNRNGIADWRERWIDRDRDGIDDRAQNRYGGASCPPGLEKRELACVPPGQAAKMFARGERLPLNYRYYTDFAAIPERYRDDIPSGYLGDRYRYIYRGDRIYVVDRQDSIIRDIIDLLD
jgi:hypothetical protein